MLPSSGYFRNILCPFFVSGFCERPHCHFKHEKRVVGSSYASSSLPIIQQSSQDPSITSIGQKTDLLQYYSDAIKKLQDELQAGTTFLVNKESVPSDESGLPVTYIPTPVNKPKAEIPPPNGLLPSDDTTESSFFVYKPTPISKLNKLKSKSESVEYVPIRIKSKSSKSRKRNHEEYDPTKVVPSAKKLKTIDPKKLDPSSSSDNEICVDNSNNDIAFSDDESQESLADNTNSTAIPSSTNLFNTSKNEEMLNIETETKCDDKYDVLNKILNDCKRTEKLGKVGLDHEKIDRAVEMCKKAKESLVSSDLPANSNDITKKENLQTKGSHVSFNKSADNETKSEKRASKVEKFHNERYNNKSSKGGKTISKYTKSHSKSDNKSSSNNSSRSHKSSKDKDHKKSSEKEDKKSSEKEDKKSSEKEDKKSSEKEDKKGSEKEDKKGSEKVNRKGSEKVDRKGSEKDDRKGSEKGDKKISEKGDKRILEKGNKKGSEKGDKKSSSSSKSDKYCSKSSKSKSTTSELSDNLKSTSKSNKKESEKSGSKLEKNSTGHADKQDTKSKLNVTDNGSEANDQKENQKKSSNTSSSSNSIHSSDKSNSKNSSKSHSYKKESDKHTSSHSKSTTKPYSSKYSDTCKKSSSGNSNAKRDKSDSKKPDENQANCTINNSSDNLSVESLLLGLNTSLSNNLFKNIEEKIEMDKLMEEYGSELDEHDTEEECWRIFNEEKALEVHDATLKETPENSKDGKQGYKEPNFNSSTPAPLFGKKREAHQPTFARELKPPKKEIQTPAEALQSRYEKLQQMYLKSHPVEKPLSPPSFVNSTLAINKKRVAHVPNAALIAAASQRVAGKFSPSNHSKTNLTINPEPTIAVTNPKGTKRVAHVPSESILARPKIPVQPGSKVPHNTRQRYLDRFIEECLKCCSTADDAYKKALNEENVVFTRSSNKNVYLNLAVNTILKLRLESTGTEQTSKGSSSKYSALAQKQTVSHEAILAGAKAAKTTYSIVKKTKHASVISGLIFYKLMTEYLLSQEQLEENGYPIPNPDAPGKAIFKKLEVTKRGNLHNPLEKMCCRCQKWYRVDIYGKYISKSSCSYHWGRLYKRKVSGSWQSRYSCCDGDHESIACCEGDGHVHEEFDPDKVTGFMQTFSKPPPDDGNYGVYALDCEMCYTTQGTELTRITVIGEDLKPVYETFVKPDTSVLDYNTRFSGITEDDLKNVCTTIRDVQAVLLSMFSDKTILIGHSLESDFRALRLIHNTVVDTAVVFPHKNGPPFKRALRNLVAEHLKKIIQNSVDGHDSQEDAASCMELMLWKIKQDMFKRR